MKYRIIKSLLAGLVATLVAPLVAQGMGGVPEAPPPKPPEVGEIGVAVGDRDPHLILGGPGKVGQYCKIAAGREVKVLIPDLPQHFYRSVLVQVQVQGVGDSQKDECATDDEVGVSLPWFLDARARRELIELVRARPK